MSALVECFLWKGLPSVDSLKISEDGATWYTITKTSTQTVQQTLSAFASAATAESGLSGAYSFDVNTTTGAVVLSSSVAFSVELLRSLPAALGFASGVLASSTSHTSTSTPLAVLCGPNIHGVNYDAPAPVEDVNQFATRWGRGKSYVHASGSQVRLEVFLPSTIAEEAIASPMWSGRLRIIPDVEDYTTGAYSSTNLRGYLDCYVHEVTETEQIGAGKHITRVGLLASLDEGY